MNHWSTGNKSGKQREDHPILDDANLGMSPKRSMIIIQIFPGDHCLVTEFEAKEM